MTRSLAAPLGLLAALLLAALPAAAITYGQQDNGLHPNVGALVEKSGGVWSAYCSGVLIADQVFLTAAHCGGNNGDAVTVSFAQDVTTGALRYEGTFHPDPRYNQAQNDPHDIAVVLLDKDPRIDPASLPSLGQFDNLKRPNGKNNPQFTAVGYGASAVTNGPGGHDFVYPDTRMYATSTLNAVNPAWLRLSMNPARDDGGTCHGDSGGPNFVSAGTNEQNVVAAITITGDTFCRATNVVYRLDTEPVQSFLRSQNVTLPSDRAAKKRR